MEKIMIINGSPRAPRSNSKKYSELFIKHCSVPTEYFSITNKNHLELCMKMEEFTDILLVFPLYADGIPVTLMNFLKTLEGNQPKQKPRISVLINCGFIEPEQNNIAVKMIEFFCKEQGYSFGSVLRVGSGEAILNTPLKIFVTRKIKQLANSVVKGRSKNLKVTMPISKKMFVKASSSYWKNYGERNGVTLEQMATMEIEK
ncbi:MAG TPA: hypothetical protein H9675_03490 [Firmicutes bacterium]|nr:hypothetical protein [Bacillota bacterium]